MDPQQNQNPIIPPSVPTPEPIVVPPPVQPVQPQSAPPSSKKGLMIGIAVGLVALLVVGGVAFALLSKKSPTTASNKGLSSDSATTPAATTHATTSKNACDLYPLADAKAIMGSNTVAASSGPPSIEDNNRYSFCTYSADKNFLTISVLSATNNSVDSGISSQWSRIADSGFTPLSGVGDKAYYNPKSAIGQSLSVLQGNTLVVIAGSAANQSQFTQIAKTIISNF